MYQLEIHFVTFQELIEEHWKNPELALHNKEKVKREAKVMKSDVKSEKLCNQQTADLNAEFNRLPKTFLENILAFE